MAKGQEPRQITLKSGETRWRGTVDAGPDPLTGKRRQRLITARTKAAYWDAVATVRASGAGAAAMPALTVRAYLLDHWFPAKDGSGIKPSTRYRYERTLHTRLLPAFGHLRLAKLSALDIERWLRELRTAKLAANTIAGYYLVLAQAMRQAYQWRLIDRNPCVGIRWPKPPRSRPPRVWTAPEATAFLAAQRGDRDEALWRVLLLGGLRVG